MNLDNNPHNWILYDSVLLNQKFWERLIESLVYETKEKVITILTHEEFLRRKTFRHHWDLTVYDHSIQVAQNAANSAIFRGLGHQKLENVLIWWLLHDFYTTPWQENTEKLPFFQKHGFVHPWVALENARKYFPEYMNKEIEEAILRHMFPLTITPPRYLEAWLVTLADKRASLGVLKDIKNLPSYLGIDLSKKIDK